MTRGLVGRIPQSMSARKSGARLQVLSDSGLLAASASGTITATETCQALIYLRGAGGAGVNGAAAPGGGGGAALFKRINLRKGDVLAYSIGAGVLSGSGQDTTVTLPGGRVLTAGGGKIGSGTVGGVGGIATGGDINRNGGAGGDDGVAATGDALPGQPGQGAGAGAGGAVSTEAGTDVAGGGGAAGITEEALFPAAANGANGGNQGAAYGGGGGGRNGAGGQGGDGVGRIILVRSY